MMMIPGCRVMGVFRGWVGGLMGSNFNTPKYRPITMTLNKARIRMYVDYPKCV